MTSSVHFYHAWVGDENEAWRGAIDDHFRWLNFVKFEGPMFVTLIGPEERRVQAEEYISGLRPGIEFTHADSGWEDLTLNRLRDYAFTVPADTAILYGHSKGSYHTGEYQVTHRNAMDSALLSHWPELLNAMLAGGFDVADLHYQPWEPLPRLGTPGFAGNHWWATARYIRTLDALPELDASTRGQAEAWIANLFGVRPKVLIPGQLPAGASFQPCDEI
jgi:hypothetical protein